MNNKASIKPLDKLIQEVQKEYFDSEDCVKDSERSAALILLLLTQVRRLKIEVEKLQHYKKYSDDMQVLTGDLTGPLDIDQVGFFLDVMKKNFKGIED